MKNQLTIFENIESVNSRAIFSACGKYRYALFREWNKNLPNITFVMLNPSTADDKKNDRTISRCIAFAKKWGFGSLVVANLFAYISTKPELLLNVDDPVGPENAKWLFDCTTASEIVICAWGNAPILKKIEKKLNFYQPLYGTEKKWRYLKLSKDGTPWHPLYINSDSEPIRF